MSTDKPRPAASRDPQSSSKPASKPTEPARPAPDARRPGPAAQTTKPPDAEPKPARPASEKPAEAAAPPKATSPAAATDDTADPRSARKLISKFQHLKRDIARQSKFGLLLLLNAVVIGALVWLVVEVKGLRRVVANSIQVTVSNPSAPAASVSTPSPDLPPPDLPPPGPPESSVGKSVSDVGPFDGLLDSVEKLKTEIAGYNSELAAIRTNFSKLESRPLAGTDAPATSELPSDLAEFYNLLKALDTRLGRLEDSLNSRLPTLPPREAVGLVIFHTTSFNAKTIAGSVLKDLVLDNPVADQSILVSVVLANEGMPFKWRLSTFDGQKAQEKAFNLNNPDSDASEQVENLDPAAVFEKAAEKAGHRRILLIASHEAKPPAEADWSRWKDVMVDVILVQKGKQASDQATLQLEAWKRFCNRGPEHGGSGVRHGSAVVFSAPGGQERISPESLEALKQSIRRSVKTGHPIELAAP